MSTKDERLIRNGDFYLQGHVGWGALGDADHFLEADAWKKYEWLVKCGWKSTKVVMLDGSDSPPLDPTATARVSKRKASAPQDVEPSLRAGTLSVQYILPDGHPDDLDEIP
jgi:hypothetical protein